MISDVRADQRSAGEPALSFEALAAMVEDSPFHQWLGVRLSSLTPDGIELTLPWRSEFSSTPAATYAHGGILAAFIDLAADYAIAARLGRGAPTVDMRADFHKGAAPGTLLARASVIKLGSTLTSAEARVYDETGQTLYASGRGVYLTLQREARP